MNDMERQFNLIADEYDKNRRNFIPCFDDFYLNTTGFLAANIKEHKRILDLGTGTGLLAYYWFRQFPNAEYVLVDIAEEMLQIARQRFAGMDTVTCQVLDYGTGMPLQDFDVIVSALSIHHFENEDKERLFAQIYDKLPSGGLFVNYDQFCAGQAQMDKWYDSYWEKWLERGTLTKHDIELWKERRKLDRECSVEQETGMLLGCGFHTVKCVYSYQKFSVIAAMK